MAAAPSTPLSPSRDHIIPLSKGGTDTFDNVQLAHFQCNWIKSDRLIPSGHSIPGRGLREKQLELV